MDRTSPDPGSEPDRSERWAESDRAYVRVVEDLIEILVRKKLIAFEDLPPLVQEKTRNRQEARKMMGTMLAQEDDTLGL